QRGKNEQARVERGPLVRRPEGEEATQSDPRHAAHESCDPRHGFKSSRPGEQVSRLTGAGQRRPFPRHRTLAGQPIRDPYRDRPRARRMPPLSPISRKTYHRTPTTTSPSGAYFSSLSSSPPSWIRAPKYLSIIGR